MTKLEKIFRDPVSSLSHMFGAVAALPVTIALLCVAFLRGQAAAGAAFLVFGVSLFLLYGASATYHGVRNAVRAKAWRKVDHMMIFVLIAGTYTPICLLTLRGAWGNALLAIIWGLAIFGIILTGVWLKAPAWISAVIYVAMGWVVILAFAPLSRSLPQGGVVPLLVGGVFYTVGAVLYAFGSLKKFWQLPFKSVGWHEVFHVFTLAGSAAHIVFMFKFVMPM